MPDRALGGIHNPREIHAKESGVALPISGSEDLLRRGNRKLQPTFAEGEEGDGKGKEDGAPPFHGPFPTSRGASRRKGPWRYRWPDDVQHEVLARLLKLNAGQAGEEKLARGKAATSAPPKPKSARGKRSGASLVQDENIPSRQRDLFA